MALVTSLLDQGAKADFRKYVEGTWGAHEQTYPICEALERGHVDVAKILLSKGASLNASKSSSDWRGCGGAATALQQALGLCFKSDDADLLEYCMKNGGADPNKPNERSIHSMRTDGSIKTYPIHETVAWHCVKCLRVLLQNGANVDALKTEHISNERGYNQNSMFTPLHLV
eukprot:PhF_6_TR4531/c1_g1_i3/m.6360